MIEQLNLDRAIEIADMVEVKAALAGLPLESRLRALGQCIILCDGPELAVFKFKWLDAYDAVVFDIDSDSSFVWEALDFLFNQIGARALALSSQGRGAGDKLRAVFTGEAFGSRCCTWELLATEYRQAPRPVVRVDKPGRIPAPLDAKTRKLLKAMQASP